MAGKIMLFYTKNPMRWLLFLSKLAFICNILFIPAFILQIKNFIGDSDASSYIIIIGFVFAILFNPLTNLCYLVLFFINKKTLLVVPVWLIVINALFLFFQVIFLLLMNIHNYQT
jgi:hypothetical protein